MVLTKQNFTLTILHIQYSFKTKTLLNKNKNYILISLNQKFSFCLKTYIHNFIICLIACLNPNIIFVNSEKIEIAQKNGTTTLPSRFITNLFKQKTQYSILSAFIFHISKAFIASFRNKVSEGSLRSAGFNSSSS